MRRIIAAREQADMLAPWRIAAGVQKWYHISPHDLSEGTELSPAGGDSPWPKASPHLWLTKPNHILQWLQRIHEGQGIAGGERTPLHVYEVTPLAEPEKSKSGIGSNDWAYRVPAAKIVRKTFTGHPWDWQGGGKSYW